MSEDKVETNITIDTSTNMEEDSDTKSRTVKKDAYFVASSDESDLIITQVQLKDNNYVEWAKAMCLVLLTKKKMGFVDGLFQIQKDNPKKEEAW